MKEKDYLLVAKAMRKARDGFFTINGKTIDKKLIEAITNLIVEEILVYEFYDDNDIIFDSEMEDKFLKAYQTKN